MLKNKLAPIILIPTPYNAERLFIRSYNNLLEEYNKSYSKKREKIFWSLSNDLLHAWFFTSRVATHLSKKVIYQMFDDMKELNSSYRYKKFQAGGYRNLDKLVRIKNKKY